MGLYRRLVLWLLWLSNSDPPMVRRHEFYALKDRLCRRYGYVDGHVWQHLVQRCWGVDEDVGCTGERCWKCHGTGVYREQWVRLECLQVGPYRFHHPSGTTSLRPPTDPSTWIEGRIPHARRGKLPREAVLWLYLLCGEWRLLGATLTCTRGFGWYAYPMLTIQRLAMPLRWGLRLKRCWCGRRYMSGRRGWNVCRACRTPQPTAIPVDDEIPF